MEKSCSLLVHFDKSSSAIASEIKEALEGNDIPAKIDAMKKAVMLLLNGEPYLSCSLLLLDMYCLVSSETAVALFGNHR